MADLGFLPAVKRLLDQTPRTAQRLLFSATLDNGVDVLVEAVPANPVAHSVDPAASPVSTMAHHVLSASAADKPPWSVSSPRASGARSLFTRTKHGAQEARQAAHRRPASPPSSCTATSPRAPASATWRRSLTARRACWSRPTSPLAASTSTTSRSSSTSTRRPSTRPTCTAPAARPAPAPRGIVVTLATPDQRADVRWLMRRAGIRPTVHAVSSGGDAIRALTGPAAEHVVPAPRSGPSGQGPGRRPGGRGRRRGAPVRNRRR